MPGRILLHVIAVALFTLTGCANGSGRAPEFSMLLAASPGGGRAGGASENTLQAVGAGWPPSVSNAFFGNEPSHVEIQVYGEPQFSANEDPKVFTTDSWRSLGTATVSRDGNFGLYTSSVQFTVPRTIPGAPPPWLGRPLYMARHKETGLIKFFQGENDHWFTFKQ